MNEYDRNIVSLLSKLFIVLLEVIDESQIIRVWLFHGKKLG